MRILFLGRIGPRLNSTTLMAKALEELGHDLEFRDWKKRIADLRGENFDLCIMCKGSPMQDQGYYNTATGMSKHQLLFWPDTMQNWRPENTHALHLGWKWSCTSTMVQRQIERQTGSALGTRIPQGAFITEDCFRPEAERPRNPIPRVLFFGITNSLRRQRVLHAMKRARIPVTIPEKPLWGYDLQAEIVSHKAVVGINNTDDVISARCQTVVAMGGRILQEWLPDMDLDYGMAPWAQGEGPVRTWHSTEDNIDDLQELCREALVGPDWRDPTAWKQWVDWMTREFSWKRRMTQIVEHATR